MDVGGGELAGFFSCDFKVCGTTIEAHGCKDGSGRYVPSSVGLDQGEIGIFVDGCNPADETGLIRFFCGGRCCGFVGTGGEEDRVSHQTYAEKPQLGFNFHRRGAEFAEGTQSRISDREINNRN